MPLPLHHSMFLHVFMSVTLLVALSQQSQSLVVTTTTTATLFPSFITNTNRINACSKNRSYVKNNARCITTTTQRNTNVLLFSNNNDDNDNKGNGIDINSDPRLYSIKIPRAPGIEWGTDLSFSFVCVRALEPGGAASSAGVEINDQICQLRSVINKSSTNDNELGNVQNLVGTSFDTVMNSFATLDKSISYVELIFFRGSKDELIKAATKDNDDKNCKEENDNDDIIITVIENKGSKTDQKHPRQIKAKKGCNVRKVLVDNGINVYQSITRWTNCSGKQLCGTCIVNIAQGSECTNRKSMDEESTLRENPNTYRLSCVTFAYGDVIVETFPPVQASQWTR